MVGQKRSLEDDPTLQKRKKNKTSPENIKKKQLDEKPVAPSPLTMEDIDFPRGGGTSLTALEVKTIRAEAAKEADLELFAEADTAHVKRKKSKSHFKITPVEATKRDRVEHLNYKRLHPGIKILGQVMFIQPLALVISLPNQLLAHVPVTQITSQLTKRLEFMDAEGSASDSGPEHEDDSVGHSQIPDLFELFYPGQYVRAVVSNIHAPGTTDFSGLGRVRDEAVKASRRVELSLIPERVNAGIQKADLKKDYTLPAAVQSVEDHGYILDFGISGVSGFLAFKEAHKDGSGESRLQIGALLDVSILAMSSNGRICTVTNDSKICASSSVSEVTAVTSVLPGMLVQSLVMAAASNGLNLQILGFFYATADEYHISTAQELSKIGQKVKARVLYDIPATTPPRFAVSLSDHHIGLQTKSVSEDRDVPIHEAFPIGIVMDFVRVKRVETDRGLLVEAQSGVEGFVHISHVSDDHIPALSASSGPWRVSSLHRARVVGYHLFDGILQLSLRPSIFEQKFLQAGDVHVGEFLKGTVKRLTDAALFVSISGNVDGVIWPNHYADITLKHPATKFKIGGSIRCRVLTVDPERKRVILTAKKTLLDTSLPILTSFGDAKVGVVTNAVVFRVSDKVLKVEFFNNVKAVVPAREASETGAKLTDAFTPGKVVKVRIIAADPAKQRIIASIRQASSSFTPSVTDISGVSIGDIVHGKVIELHKLNAVLLLNPSASRALISFTGLANHWGTTVSELKASLNPGAAVESLVVVSRNPEKGFVVVTGRPKSMDQVKKGTLSMDTVTTGQIVGGRVIKHGRHGALVKLTPRISGTLHPTDTCDDYEAGNPFPAVDSILKAVVVDIDKSTNHISLSTRRSRLSKSGARPPVDREITGFHDLKVGDTIRGFVKSVADHGLFVMLGRGIDARVQIRELFDEYVKDWKSHFAAKQLVNGRVLNVDTANNKVEMTLRSGDLSRDSSKSLSFGDILEGQKVTGRIKRIEHYGLFIEIDDSKISGLCHKSELSDNKDADVTVALRTFREGDKVKAVILKRDLEKKQLSLGLKPSYFAEDADVHGHSTCDRSREADTDVLRGLPAEGDGDEFVDTEYRNESDSEMAEPNTDDDCESDDGMLVDFSISPTDSEPQRRQPEQEFSQLKLKGFRWFPHRTPSPPESSNADFALSESDENEDAGKKKKRRKRKSIEQDLTADMQSKLPESNADFERLLLGSPNSSYLWMRYMSFQLQLSDIDKARVIGRRAIQTIDFREEQEKLNIWIALLNLENVYGTEASMKTVFRDAARHNDSKTVHLRLAAIFDDSGKHEKAEEQYKRTCKKFSQSSKVWTLLCEHYLRRARLEEARKVLSRSLQSLEKRKHLKTIFKFAQLEYKLGDAERGRTIFEGIVDSHPKRWDIWSIYIDMEAGQKDIQNLRNIFNRVLAVKMTSYKAKSFFKKWLDLERKIGDEEGATVVKQKAVEWTKKAAATS
ncbi:hypothetical protein F5I97DRAFT_1927833 [Phlebopus sp. FC_14]|nr:hypothetical protein F5I97DRAFT_1927833 [Phlebopus sp. FC_14]